MSILGNILEKLGIKKPAAPAAGAAKPAGLDPTKFRPAVGAPQAAGGAFVPAKPPAMPMVDVVSKLDTLAKKSPIKLDWKVSINDLMALLGMKHTAQDIKDLAVELGCPASEMDDSYKRNVWTHKALLKKIAENGGNIPASLLD
jgi:hypothetical protein